MHGIFYVVPREVFLLLVVFSRRVHVWRAHTGCRKKTIQLQKFQNYFSIKCFGWDLFTIVSWFYCGLPVQIWRVFIDFLNFYGSRRKIWQKIKWTRNLVSDVDLDRKVLKPKWFCRYSGCKFIFYKAKTKNLESRRNKKTLHYWKVFCFIGAVREFESTPIVKVVFGLVNEMLSDTEDKIIIKHYRQFYNWDSQKTTGKWGQSIASLKNAKGAETTIMMNSAFLTGLRPIFIFS